MAIQEFPSLRHATDDGLLAIGGDLEIDSLKLAYNRGIFPWPHSDDYPLAWFCPDPRGVLRSSELHIPRSLKKLIRKGVFEVKYNQNFSQVVLKCAQGKTRKGPQGTWITPAMRRAYTDFHRAGYAFSVETYFEGELVGGLYGVQMGSALSGESMFFDRPNASKVALVDLMQRIDQAKIPWLDTQMITPVVSDLGGTHIPRDQFLGQLKDLVARKLPHDFFEG